VTNPDLDGVEVSASPDESHIDKLRTGVDAWNQWRAGRTIVPLLAGLDLTDLTLAGADLSGADLRGADLSDADLHDADLHDADLRDADLFATDLTKANLKMTSLVGADMSLARLCNADLYKADMAGAFMTEADLSGAYLAGADLAGADLRGAVLRDVNASEASLRHARLDKADLCGANLSSADITDAHLNQANLDTVDLFGVSYGSFQSMEGHFFGIRGLQSAHGNALFVRDAQDQDYIETLRRTIDDEPLAATRVARRVAFSLWARIDYGRSLGKLAMYALMVALGFGVVFAFDRAFDWGLLDYSGGSGSALSPFYFSIITYTTLGFGDITPASWQGEVLVVAEVIFGYTTLGLLLSILANRVARRA
jgi:hypothetical protein